MASYRVCDELRPIMERAMELYHGQLLEAGVRVGLLEAFAKRNQNGEAQGPAIRHHGYPAAAVIKINSLKDRVEGKPDATITVDGDRRGEWSEERLLALFDHELCHLQIVVDDDGNVILDDANRPKLKSVPHDAEVGVFWCVVDRHKRKAFETTSFEGLTETFTQMQFPWGE